MSIDITEPSTLNEMLARISRPRLERSIDAVQRAPADYDYVLRQSLASSVVATPRCGGAGIVAKMVNVTPRHIYTIVAGTRQLEVHFREGSGGNIANFDHYIFDLADSHAARGRIDYFPNNGFVFTNEEKCRGLTIIRLDDAQYIQYRAQISTPWWRASTCTVTLDADYEKLATITAAPCWLLSKRRLSTTRSLPAELVGLLMATDHGLVFERNR